MNCEQSTKLINQIKADFEAKIEEVVMSRVRVAMSAFKHRYPKRSIKLVAGMGTCYFVIDDNILHYEYGQISHLDGYTFINGNLKTRELLSMLIDFMDWYRSEVLDGVYYDGYFMEDIELF